MSRLKEQYQNEIVKAMIEKFGYKNIMEVPKLDKIVVNMGVGEAKENAKLLEAAVKDMETITGQKAVTTKAKNSVANFKIREGMAIGCKTTLRGEKMYDFADRLINLALPRVRDFRGVSADSFDGRGNYALGIKEHIPTRCTRRCFQFGLPASHSVPAARLLPRTAASADKTRAYASNTSGLSVQIASGDPSSPSLSR